MRTQLTIVLMSLFVLKANGQSQLLDSNFNGIGFLQTDYKAKSFDNISNIKLSNNSIYSIGEVSLQDYKFYESGFGVLKHSLTSGLDNSFGYQGKAHYYFDSYHRSTATKDIYEYADGSLLILSEQGLIKINQNGVLDDNFGFNGKKHFEPIPNLEFNKLLILPNGKIYIFGKKGDDLCIEKYNADGFLDLSFGNQGTITLDLGTIESINDAQLLNDGKILIVGYSQKQINNNPTIVTRYNIIRKINLDGMIDLNFGYDDVPSIYDKPGVFKKVLLDNSNTYAYIINQINDCDHRILRFDLQSQTISNFFYNPSGNPWLCWGLSSRYIINDIVLNNNQLYIAGNESISGGNSIWITRYNLDGNIDITFANQGNFNYFIYDGSATSPSDSPVNLQSIQIASDGSIYGGGRFNSDFLVFKILKSINLSTDDINGEDNILKVYPNPVRDFLYANTKSIKTNIVISVYDMSGKLVKKQTFDSGYDNKVAINLSDLVTGNYVVKYEANGFLKSVRIIKK